MSLLERLPIQQVGTPQRRRQKKTSRYGRRENIEDRTGTRQEQEQDGGPTKCSTKCVPKAGSGIPPGMQAVRQLQPRNVHPRLLFFNKLREARLLFAPLRDGYGNRALRTVADVILRLDREGVDSPAT